MSQSLGRVIQSVVTHNRLQECEVMWQQHRHQLAHEQERGGEESDSRTAAARNTLASIEQARDAAAARKLAARSAETQAAAASSSSDSSDSSDSSSDSERHGKKRRRKEEKREKKSRKRGHGERDKKQHREKEKHKRSGKEKHERNRKTKRQRGAFQPASLSVMGAAFSDDDGDGAQHDGAIVLPPTVEPAAKDTHPPRVLVPAAVQGPSATPSLYTGKEKFPSQHPWFGYR
jgi:hypothetical protein